MVYPKKDLQIEISLYEKTATCVDWALGTQNTVLYSVTSKKSPNVNKIAQKRVH